MRMVNRSQGITKSLFRCLSLLLVILGAALFVNAQDNKADRTAIILNVADAIGPATWDYLHRGLEKSHDRNAAVVILRLDTPGGLDTAMRKIIQDIIASPVPVIVYVSPSGARAASAGTYMMYASHIAAMAPGTNLGAATPVQLGGVPDIQPPTMPEPEEVTPDEEDGENDGENGDKEKDKEAAKKKDKEPAKPTGDAMKQKVLNDSIAYIRSLAEMRGRNVEWAEKAVREASSISADKALQLGVIDIVAADIDDLLEQANGWQVNVNGIDRTLDTGSLVVEKIEPDWRNELLAVITNPNVAYILMLLGIYGLFFEFVNPGFVVPGVTGAICLLLAMYALQVLPVNYAGLGLILLGIIFMVAEVFAPSFGALGIGGVISFVVGSVILFDTEGSNMQVAIPLIVVVSAVTAGFILVAIRLVFASHKKPVVSGSEEMVGSIGEALEDFEGKGRIRVHSETWNAIAEKPVKSGDKVKVTELDGLVLRVAPIEEEGK